MRKVLVTGANGYIGSNTIKKLLDFPVEITAVDISEPENKNQKVAYKKINILDGGANSKTLYNDLNCPDTIIHLAWQDGFNHYAPSHLANLSKHFDFLKNMIDSGAKSISVMGTVHEVGYFEGCVDENTQTNPLSYYGVAKNALRQLMFIYSKDKNISLKWLRAYYITGDDLKNHSVFTKLIEAQNKGQKTFPFVEGTNKFDFIDIQELSLMIAKASLQDKIDGIINVCSGVPVSLKDKVEEFIKKNNFDIKLQYGVFPQRKYDSPIVYGDNSKIKAILGDC